MTARPFFRQLFDADSSTYTYLLADEETGEAVLIDPVIEQVDRDLEILKELGFRLVYALDTHVHADHVTAAGVLKERLGCKTVLSERAGSVRADLLVKDGDRVPFGRFGLEVRETPGHTNGCLTYVMEDQLLAFTGDALLIRGCGRTDFQGGDSRTLYRSVRGKILSLPAGTVLYPAHDYKGRTSTRVSEEKQHNPRLGDAKSEDEFVAIMAGLKLPNPKKMAGAVPANLECGVPAPPPAVARQLDSGWAPVILTPAGVPEVSPAWVHANKQDVTVIDVREPDEYRGELGHIAGASLVPLATVAAAASSIDAQKPLVVVCRSGGRSGKAALWLAERGFARVASMAGGMRAWNAERFGVDYGSPQAAVPAHQG